MLNEKVLRNKTDFDKLYKQGKSVGDKYVVVFVRPNGKEIVRTAFLASKKVGNSVERNRARRLMKESYRLSLADVLKGVDVVFIARNTIKDKKQKEVERSMNAALTKVGILYKKK